MNQACVGGTLTKNDVPIVNMLNNVLRSLPKITKEKIINHVEFLFLSLPLFEGNRFKLLSETIDTVIVFNLDKLHDREEFHWLYVITHELAHYIKRHESEKVAIDDFPTEYSGNPEQEKEADEYSIILQKNFYNYLRNRGNNA